MKLSLVLIVSAVLCALGCSVKETPDAGAGHHYGMVNVPPVLNPSWGGSASSPDGGGPLTYFIDPASAVGTCSDATNTGLSSSSPLCTWHELHDHIWGCGAGLGYGGQACPRFRQNVTVVFESSQTGNTDPIYFSPRVENGAIVMLQGNLGTAQTTTTGTLLSVTAKNRATPVVLKSTVTGADGGTSALAAGQLIVNSTHSSRSWVYQNATGTASFSQPLAPATLPMALNAYTLEVDTWANADAYTVFAPVNIDLVRFTPVISHESLNGTNGTATLAQVNVYEPQTLDAGVGPDTATINHEVSVVDVSFAKAVNVTGDSAPPTVAIWQNVYVASSMTAATVPSQIIVAGGVLGAQAGSASSSLSNVNLDADVIIGGSGSVFTQGTMTGAGSGGQLGLVMVDTSATLGVSDGLVYAKGVYSGAPIIWGAGTLNLTGQSRLRYATGASQAAATFKLTTLNLNGQTKFCSGNPAQSATTLTCNLSLTAATLDTTLGSTITAGCGFNPGGGGYCNGGF